VLEREGVRLVVPRDFFFVEELRELALGFVRENGRLLAAKVLELHAYRFPPGRR
jgi:hypothetical protein